MKVLLFLGPHWAESHMPLGCIPAPFFLETSGLLGSCPVVPIELVTFVSVGFSPLHFASWGLGAEASPRSTSHSWSSLSQAPPFAACWCFQVRFYPDFAFAMGKTSRNLMGLIKWDVIWTQRSRQSVIVRKRRWVLLACAAAAEVRPLINQLRGAWHLA